MRVEGKEHEASDATKMDVCWQPEPWLDRNQLSHYLAMSKQWIDLKVKQGMPMVRFGNRPHFKVATVEAWLFETGKASS